MLLTELRREAVRQGESRQLVTTTINPIIRYYSQLRRRIEYWKEHQVPWSPAEYRGITEGPSTVEWYIESIGDLDSYDLISINGFGPKRKEYMDYLVSTYYEGGPAVDIYEMPPGQDY